MGDILVRDFRDDNSQGSSSVVYVPGTSKASGSVGERRACRLVYSDTMITVPDSLGPMLYMIIIAFFKNVVNLDGLLIHGVYFG